MTTTTFSPNEILNRICDHYRVKPEAVNTAKGGDPSRHHIAQMYSYCLWLYTYLTRATIGEITGRDPSNVYATVKMIRERCQVDKEYRKKIIEIESLFE